jgi:glutamate N-acetyltransferase / amino-acid N-acetyltransferase
MYTEVTGGVTAARGFKAAGVRCGIKQDQTKKDLAIVFSEVPSIAAATFTTSAAAAPPVHVNKDILKNSAIVRGIVVNSGNANSCTGERGKEDARTMIRTATELLGIPADQFFASSTGIIGEYLPMDKIVPGIAEAVSQLSKDNHASAAEAIMTTDTVPKENAITFTLDDTEVSIGGMAKGSGMIAPNMATMLSYVTTDADITQPLLQKALRSAVDKSFNCISVDGDTSTNDMVGIFANGRAGNKKIVSEQQPQYARFADALEYLLRSLARKIVIDGEGATKLIEIQVHGAEDEESARKACKAIGNSNLFKTAVHGEDPNWGRIVVALGYSGAAFDPGKLDIYIGDVPVYQVNYKIDFNFDDARRALAGDTVTVTVNLHKGNARAAFWTCDLTQEYIVINAHYHT